MFIDIIDLKILSLLIIRDILNNNITIKRHKRLDQLLMNKYNDNYMRSQTLKRI